jgi:hypothetical protein
MEQLIIDGNHMVREPVTVSADVSCRAIFRRVPRRAVKRAGGSNTSLEMSQGRSKAFKAKFQYTAKS